MGRACCEVEESKLDERTGSDLLGPAQLIRYCARWEWIRVIGRDAIPEDDS